MVTECTHCWVGGGASLHVAHGGFELRDQIFVANDFRSDKFEPVGVPDSAHTHIHFGTNARRYPRRGRPEACLPRYDNECDPDVNVV